jgi:hypothetical protein
MLFMLLKNIRLNKKTELYEVVEAGFKYEFGSFLLDNLGSYFKQNPKQLIGHWYKTLPEYAKEKVKQSWAF